MKSYTLSQINFLFGENIGKEIVKTKIENKFRLVPMVDYWDTIDNYGNINGYCSDTRHNVYEVISDPTGLYRPYRVWKKTNKLV